MGRPDSPCQGICALDERALCIGCRRTMEEIAAWEDLGAEDQWHVIAQLPGRAAVCQEN